MEDTERVNDSERERTERLFEGDFMRENKWEKEKDDQDCKEAKRMKDREKEIENSLEYERD